jgi:hypothetical protein
MPADPKRVQAVFLAAVEFQDPADRAALLERECSADSALRQRVDALLRAHDRPDSDLDQPLVGPIKRSEGDGNGPDADVTFDRSPVQSGATAAATDQPPLPPPWKAPAPGSAPTSCCR